MKMLDRKRIWAVIITIVMVLSVMPAPAMAEAFEGGESLLVSAAETTSPERSADPETDVELVEPEESSEQVKPEEPAEPTEEPVGCMEREEPDAYAEREITVDPDGMAADSAEEIVPPDEALCSEDSPRDEEADAEQEQPSVPDNGEPETGDPKTRITFTVRPDDRTGIAWDQEPSAWALTEEIVLNGGSYDLSTYSFSTVFGVAVPDEYGFCGWSDSSSTSDTNAIGVVTVDPQSEIPERTVYAILVGRKPSVRIIANSKEADYTGTEQTVTGFKEIKVGDRTFPVADALQFTFDGQTYSIVGVTAAGGGTDAGTYPVSITGTARVTLGGRDVTGDFSLSTIPGRLKIDPIDAEVTIEGHRETLVYDGEEHTVTGYDVRIGTPLYRETDFIFTGTAEVVGRGAREFPMELAPDQFENRNPNFADVVFSVIDGGLTITRRPVTLRSPSASKVYDGMPLEKREVMILGDGFAGDEMPIILAIGSIQNVGKTKNRIIVDFGNAPKGLSNHWARRENYEITLDEGVLEIMPKPVIVKAKDQQKKYGAKDPSFTAVVEGLLSGDSVHYTITREEGEKSGYYTITPSGETLQGNYELIFQSGTLHIKKQPKKPKERFALAWFSDAKIDTNGARAEALEAMVDWTVENANAKNIIGLFGTGSLVGAFNDAGTEARGVWILSKTLAARRDLRYYGVAGTIDVNGNEMNYGPYANRGVRGASSRYRGGELWVQPLFDTGVIAVGIGYHKIAGTEEELDAQRRWIDYVNRYIALMRSGSSAAILFVNDYVDETGRLTPFGELIESGIVAKNPDVRMILSSCASGSVHVEATYGDRTVNILAFNYSEDEANGLGFLRILTFDPGTRDVELTTYSPVCDKTIYDEAKPESDAFIMKNAY